MSVLFCVCKWPLTEWKITEEKKKEEKAQQLFPLLFCFLINPVHSSFICFAHVVFAFISFKKVEGRCECPLPLMHFDCFSPIIWNAFRSIMALNFSHDTGFTPLRAIQPGKHFV